MVKSHNDTNNTLKVPREKSETVSFTFSMMKKIFAHSARFRFPVKLICCIAFRSASSACCLHKSIAINL